MVQYPGFVWQECSGSVTASLTVEIKTILDDPFIKLLVGRVNNLNDKHVNDVLIDGKGDEVPESEDNVIENYKGA